jgi:hypothetical protein
MPKIGNIEFNVGSSPQDQTPAAPSAQEGTATAPTAEANTAPVASATESPEGTNATAAQQPEQAQYSAEQPKAQAASTDQPAVVPREWEILLADETFKSLAQSFLAGDEDAVLSVMSEQVGRLKELRTDYKSMDADSVIRAKVQKEYPDLYGRALEKAIERYHAANFGEAPDPDSDDDGDISLYNSTKNRHAQKLRAELLAEQEKLRSKSIDHLKLEVEEHLSKQKQEQEKAQKAWEAQLMGNQVIASAIKDGSINVGKPDKPVLFKLPDQERFKKAVAEDAEFFSLFATGDKEKPVDLSRWARVVAFALDPEGYDAAILAAGSSSGKEAIMDELINPAKPNPTSPPSPSTLGDAILSAIRKR